MATPAGASLRSLSLKQWEEDYLFLRAIEFWKNVPVRGKGCWIWQGSEMSLPPSSNSRTAYGRFWFDGRYWGAHQFAYLLVRGTIPKGRVVRHMCPGRRNPNKGCVNPFHLEVGTYSQNQRDHQRCIRQNPDYDWDLIFQMSS